MDDGTNYWALFALVFPLGLFLFVCGLLVYWGKFMAFLAFDGIFPGRPSLGSTYVGVALMCTSIAHFVTETDSPLLLLPFVAVLFSAMILGVGSFLWVPGFLRPQWMKDHEQQAARGEDPHTRNVLHHRGQL